MIPIDGHSKVVSGFIAFKHFSESKQQKKSWNRSRNPIDNFYFHTCGWEICKLEYANRIGIRSLHTFAYMFSLHHCYQWNYDDAVDGSNKNKFEWNVWKVYQNTLWMNLRRRGRRKKIQQMQSEFHSYHKIFRVERNTCDVVISWYWCVRAIFMDGTSQA